MVFVRAQTMRGAASRAAILEYIGACGVRRPTVREIGEAVGLYSTASVQRHLDALVRQGKLLREPGRSRTLTLPGEHCAHCAGTGRIAS